MFARDEWPYSEALDTKNLYGKSIFLLRRPHGEKLMRNAFQGVHPFYMVLEPDGKAHGVFILNSNAQVILRQLDLPTYNHISYLFIYLLFTLLHRGTRYNGKTMAAAANA